MKCGHEAIRRENPLLAGTGTEDLWGISIYCELPPDERVEFDSMINIRPRQGNRSRGVDDETTRARILAIVNRMVGG